MQQVTINLARHIEVAVMREAKNRGMALPELCLELIEIALVNMGGFKPTPIEERATRQAGAFVEPQSE